MTAGRTQQAAPSWHQLSRMEIQLSMKLCNLFTAEMCNRSDEKGRWTLRCFYQQTANGLSALRLWSASTLGFCANIHKSTSEHLLMNPQALVRPKFGLLKNLRNFVHIGGNNYWRLTCQVTTDDCFAREASDTCKVEKPRRVIKASFEEINLPTLCGGTGGTRPSRSLFDETHWRLINEKLQCSLRHCQPS